VRRDRHRRRRRRRNHPRHAPTSNEIAVGSRSSATHFSCLCSACCCGGTSLQSEPIVTAFLIIDVVDVGVRRAHAARRVRFGAKVKVAQCVCWIAALRATFNAPVALCLKINTSASQKVCYVLACTHRCRQSRDHARSTSQYDTARALAKYVTSTASTLHKHQSTQTFLCPYRLRSR
jgi:hypothetical protein